MPFKKGVAANPKGRPPGYQDFVVRAKYLMGLYTIDQIQEIVGDSTKFGKLSVFDGMILRRVCEAIQPDGDKSMNSLLDRLLGKPPQYIETKNETNMTVSVEERKKQAADEAEMMLNELSKRTAEAKEAIH